jgi:hypothetical protein
MALRMRLRPLIVVKRRLSTTGIFLRCAALVVCLLNDCR